MKSLFVLLSLITATHSFAASTQDIKIDGTKTEFLVLLEQTKPKSVVDQAIAYDATCYREESDGTKTECSSFPHEECNTTSTYKCETKYREECGYTDEEVCKDDRECEIINGVRFCNEVRNCTDVSTYVCDRVPFEDCGYSPSTSCNTKYTQECKEVPKYKTVYYECTKFKYTYKTIQHTTKADVKFQIDSLPNHIKISEKVTLKVENESFVVGDFKTLDGKPSEFVWEFDRNLAHNSVSEKEVLISGTIKAIPAHIKSVDAPLKLPITDLKINGEDLSFSVPEILYPEFYVYDIRFERKGFLNYSFIYHRPGSLKELNLTNNNGRTIVSVDLSQLSAGPDDRERGSYRITFELALSAEAIKLHNLKYLSTNGIVKAKLQGK